MSLSDNIVQRNVYQTHDHDIINAHTDVFGVIQ